jgi:hypothetical protein
VSGVARPPEIDTPDQARRPTTVASADRTCPTLPCEPQGGPLELARIEGGVAQRLERRLHKPYVGGSIPPAAINEPVPQGTDGRRLLTRPPSELILPTPKEPKRRKIARLSPIFYRCHQLSTDHRCVLLRSNLRLDGRRAIVPIIHPSHRQPGRSESMKRATCLILALACTSGCKNIAQMIRPPQSPPATVTEPPLVKLSEARPEDSPANDGRKVDASVHAKPQEANAKPVENQGRAGSVVADQSGATAGRLRKDTFCNAGPRPEATRNNLAKSNSKETSQAMRLADKPTAKPGLHKTEDQRSVADAAGSLSNSDQASQGLSKEAWYGIGTICGALFTSILAPLLVDFIRHCIGFGSSFHHPRCRDSEGSMM